MRNEIPGLEFGRIPPKNVEVESMVIGAILIDQNCIHDARLIINNEDFYHIELGRAFEAAERLIDRAENVDLVTVISELKKMGAHYSPHSLAELTQKVVSTSNIETHCRIIKEMSIKRKLIVMSHETSKKGFDEMTDAFEVLNSCELSIHEIKESVLRTKRTGTKEIIDQLLIRMKDRDGIGWPMFNYEDFDIKLGNVEPGELITIAGRPGMGKSILLNSIVKKNSIDLNRRGLVWGLEMTNEQTVRRLVAATARVDYNDIKVGNMSAMDWERVETAISKILKSKIIFEDRSGVNVIDIRSRAISEHRKHALDYIAIDHGGLLDHLSKGNDASEIGKTTKVLKQLAKELKIPIFLLWQLNRSVEHRPGSIPKLSDLRDSGTLEQDSDKVMFVYRPDYYQIDSYEYENQTLGSTDLGVILIRKNREGTTGESIFKFNPKHMLFDPWTITDKIMSRPIADEVPF